MIKNIEFIDKIEYYQKSGVFHPFTCGNNSRYSLLIAVEKNYEVILKCIDCKYVQDWIPSIPSIEKIKSFKESLNGGLFL